MSQYQVIADNILAESTERLNGLKGIKCTSSKLLEFLKQEYKSQPKRDQNGTYNRGTRVSSLNGSLSYWLRARTIRWMILK